MRYIVRMDRLDGLLSRRFKHVVDKARQLNGWQQQLDSVLDPLLRGHIQVANYHDGRLKLMAENATWATRVRFAAPQLLVALKGSPGGIDLTDISCVVRPPIIPPTRPQPKTERSISAEARDLLASTAETIKDPKLKDALQKLSGKNLPQADP